MTEVEPKLSPAVWVGAALDALARHGAGGVSVERLARELRVTKGSFYWHFDDKDALLAAALDEWERTFTEHVIAEASRLDDPRERLARLIGQVSRGGRGDRIHLALANADHPLVRAALARVTKRRLGFLEECYAALGQKPREARESALLAYAAYVGLVHLRIDAPNALPTRRAFHAYVEFLVAKLVPPARSRRRKRAP